MRPEGTPIQTLLLRTFLPAVVVVAMALAALVYNWLYISIIDGFDRKLVTASALTGALIDPADHDRLMAAALAGGDAEKLEAGADYRRNVEPMRKIRTTLGLTYLYSQALSGGPLDVVYVLDSSLGDEHSTLGSKDELTQETIVGLKKTQADGSIYVSPIEYQEQWGLLKTAAAPVYGKGLKITSTAGADVNISVIQVATQNALFASALIGIGSILACVAVALWIVRVVARPITALKQEALRIAAGDAAQPASIKGPREVGQLRDALAALAEKMAAASEKTRETAARHELETNRAILRGIPMPGSPVLEAVSASETSPVAPGRPEEAAMEVSEETVRNLLALRRVAAFDMLSDTELLLVAGQVRLRHFAADTVLLAAGTVADMLFVVIEGQALTDRGAAPQVFDAPSALFGLPARSDYRAGPEGIAALCLAKPHLFTIARECPDFVVGLATAIQERA
jgi:hypothetical protein